MVKLAVSIKGAEKKKKGGSYISSILPEALSSSSSESEQEVEILKPNGEEVSADEEV
jgi:hypothetical protein